MDPRAGEISSENLRFGLTLEHTFGTIEGMGTQTLTRPTQLAARLVELDSAIASLQVERFAVLAELRSIDEAEGKSERQTAVTVAQISRSSARLASSQIGLGVKLAALPLIVDAMRTGEISAAQLNAVVTIATPETQADAIVFAQQSSNADLERAASVRRGELTEQRQRSQKDRFLSFTKYDDHVSIRGSLPFQEGDELEKQLRKIADRLNRGEANRPTASVRMADALLIFTKYNPANALADSMGSTTVTDFDEEPFPEFTEDTSVPKHTDNSVTVFKSDVKMIIHFDPQSGIANYENGPPIDHPRLMALLCDATLEAEHLDQTGQPTGLFTRSYHANWRQDRYLAHRDGPCRVPDCLGIGKTQAHHIFEDRADRITDTKYMINLCNRDHGDHHDNNIEISGDPEGVITFTYPDGRVVHSHARPAINKFA
jgi:Domain of unknown function (DUF222)